MSESSVKHTIVVGLQHGDESKGRLVDNLVDSGEFNHVVRYNGGCNAGHSVWIGGKKIVTHSVPTGIINPDTMNYIGPGCLINPVKLIAEIKELESLGITNIRDRLLIDHTCNFITQEHIERDVARELTRSVGSTKQGMAPAYSDKYGREGKNFLSNPELVKDLSGLFGDVGLELRYTDDEAILYEGAQGTMLDIDSPSYPNVTSSHCTAPYAMIGSGYGMFETNPRVIGVIKPYLTKVGTGPFPSSVEGTQEAEAIRKAGNEFGSTTGRPRMIGHINISELKYAVQVNGVTELGMFKNDVIWDAGLQHVGAYYEAGEQGFFPSLKAFKAWKSIEDKEFQVFRSFLEWELGVKIKYLGFGTDRSQFKVVLE